LSVIIIVMNSMDEECEREMDDWIDQALKRGEGFKSDEERQEYIDSLGENPIPRSLHYSATDMLLSSYMHANMSDIQNYTGIIGSM